MTLAYFAKIMTKKEKGLIWCVIITLCVMGLEIYFGIVSNSLMLVSDGLHMLTHAASLFVSLLAIWLSKNKHTANKIRIETKAAFINGISLVIFVIYLIWESIARIQALQAIEVSNLLVVALIGLGTNLLTAFILFRAGVDDLNTRSAYLHMLADTFSSIAIVIGSITIYYTSWFVIDAILSIVVAIIIAKWSFGLVKNAIGILYLQRSPSDMNHHLGLD